MGKGATANRVQLSPRAVLPLVRRVSVTQLVWALGACGLALQIGEFIAFQKSLREPAQPDVVRSAGRPGAQFSLETVQAAHLFGATPADPTAVTTTTLALSLTGVIATDNPRLGFGILGESAQATRLYAVGASVPGEATLYQVFADHVVLARNGQFEVLKLRRALDGAPAALVAFAHPDTAQAGGPTEDGPPTPVPVTWFAALNPQAVSDETTFQGFRLNASGRFQSQWGLQPDDLLVAINGAPMLGAASVKIALQHVTGNSVTFTVRRNGAPVDVTINPTM